MDASVIAAIAKWPNVPAVYGWLALTQRGEWRLRGEAIQNTAIRDFIGRNYASDERGRWYFQNGPQRVFVELEVAPWVWRVDSGGHGLLTHTGAAARQLLGAWLDDQGRVFLRTDLGFGLVDSADTARVGEAFRTADQRAPDDSELESWLNATRPQIRVHGARLGLSGDCELEPLRAAEVPERFGYVRRPKAD